MQPEGLNLGQENNGGNWRRWKGGLFHFCLLGLIKKKMMIKTEESVILEGFDATLSREEDQKLTKIMRPRH